MSNKEQNIQKDFYKKVADLLKEARRSVVQTVNRTMVYTYFEIGRMIVEEEQKGKERAAYGKQILKELSIRLKSEFGKGFSVTNLKQMRSFFLSYQKGQTLSDEFTTQKQQTLSAKSESNPDQPTDLFLSWSHYLFLMRIENISKIKILNNNFASWRLCVIKK